MSVAVATMGATTGGALVERMTPRGRARAAARRTRRAFVRETTSGLVRLEGKVEYAGEPLVAPLSGRACAHYEAGVELPTRSGAFRRTLVASKSQPFYLMDESGRALVDASRALVDVVLDHRWNASDLDAERRFELEQFLYSTGQDGLRHLQAARRLRYVEGAIEEGETVSVVGIANVDRASEAGSSYREGARRITVEAPTGGSIFVSDALHYR